MKDRYHNLLDEELLRCLYLVFGDGSYKDKLYFSNKFPELHRYVIDTLTDCFKIGRESWKLRILHHEEKDDALRGKVVSYWLSCLKFSENQLYPTISHSDFRTARQGNARVELGRRIFGKIVKHIISQTNSGIAERLLTRRQLLSVLDGILNAEGSALIDKVGLHKIVITVNHKELRLVESILDQLSLASCFRLSKQEKYVCSGWHNFYRFLYIWIKNDLLPFSLHPVRFYNLVTGFAKHKRTVSLGSYLEVVENSPGTTFREIALKLGHNLSSVSKQIKKFCELFVIEGKGVNSNPYRIYISGEGKRLLTVIKKLKGLETEASNLLNNHNLQLEAHGVS